MASVGTGVFTPQVAEMHGELMEFNERLHKLLRLRESQVSVGLLVP